MSKILYNNADVFSGLAPTPLYSRSAAMIRFGDRWAQRHDLKLEGKLTGKCITYTEFISRKNQLLSGLNKDFQSLEIYDGPTLVETFPLVKINGIDFDDSTYANGYVPFTINLEAYPQEYFSGDFGILEPAETVQFAEEDDGRITLTHTTSAVGLCTSATSTNNALENARQWVAARTGWYSQILPAFVSGMGNGVCLQTIGENYDRLNARYEVVEKYFGDRYNTVTDAVLRYTTVFSSGIDDGISTMQVEGNIKGCRYQDLSGIRAKYQAFDAFSEAVNQFERITHRTDLNPIPTTKGVNEDVNNKAISFTYTYNDDLRPRINIVFETDFSYEFENDVVTASISATVSSRAPYSATRWSEVQAVANQVDLYSLVVPGYNVYVNQVAPHLAAFPLNPRPISTSRSQNEFAATASLSATYSNAPTPPLGLDKFNSTVNITPSIHKYNAAPILDGAGDYYIFDLGFRSRGSIEISVNGIGSDSTTPDQTLAILKTQVQNIHIDYFNGARQIMDAQSYTTGNASFGKAQSVQASFSAESTEFTL